MREICLPWGTVYGVIAGISLGCDIAMLGIPATLIARLQASRKRKIQLSFVLFPSLITESSFFLSSEYGSLLKEIQTTVVGFTVP